MLQDTEDKRKERRKQKVSVSGHERAVLLCSRAGLYCEHWRWTVGQEVSCVLHRFVCQAGRTDSAHADRKLA